MQLVDQYGKSLTVSKKDLQTELLPPSVMQYARMWNQQSVAANLTPERLASILDSANYGYHNEFLTLAEEIEERDLHYAALIGTRKRAVSGLETTVIAASDNSKDQEIADAVRELVATPDYKLLNFNSLDALAKSYSVTEIIWTGTTRWIPKFKWRDPRNFRFDDNGELHIYDATKGVMKKIPPYKFITHQPVIKSGLQIRSGIARLALFAYLCKRWTIKDWMTFADIYGIPLRIGRYENGTTPENIEKLISAVTGIGNDAAGVIPKNMEIEFPTPRTGSGGELLFERMADWWDRQMSKGILGQTMTTDNGSSLSQALVHNDVRLDIAEDDALQLSATNNRDLVRAFVDINFGPQNAYPQTQIRVPKPEDLTLLINALKELVPLGLRVEQSVIRDKLGLPDPPENVDPSLLFSVPPDFQKVASNRLVSIAANKPQKDLEGQDAIDAMVVETAKQAGKYALDPKAIQSVIFEARDKEDLEKRLLRLFVDSKSTDQGFIDALERADFAAQIVGYVSANERIN